jgi:hypothetical protein
MSGSVSDQPQQQTADQLGAAAGSRTYYRGLPLILRDSRYAARHTKTNRVISAMPRQKFLFYASFNAGPAISSLRNFSSWQTGFAFQIKSMDRPKFAPEAKVLKQYNRKRVIYTGIDYADLSITLHDTVDDRVLRVWRDYYNWYFGDGRIRPNTTSGNAVAWRSSVIEKEFSIGSGWGFSPQPGPDTNFFESLDIYTFYGGKYTKMRVYNPKISSLDFDTLETESSGLNTIQMSIKHEGVAFEEVAFKLSPELISKFNLNGGDYYEPADMFGGVNTFLLELDDSIQNALDGLLNNVASNIPFVGQVLSSLGSRTIQASGITGIGASVAQRLGASSLARWGKFF